MVQLSFTLPMPHSKVAEGAAAQLANKMGMDPALVVHSKPMGPDFTFFVVYGRVNHLVDPSKVEVVERDYPLLTPKEVNAAVKQALRRRLVVVGGCIGTDAHTVGIDAILNIKGFAGEKGLEYYRELKVVNLGAQVSVPELVDRALAEKADAVLVSQVVTQRDAHLLNTREMSAAFREAYPAERRPLLVVGGPRFDEAMAAELGVDRVFARGTTPGEVASFLVHRSPSSSEGIMTGSACPGRGRPRVVHRRYVPYSHAHYAGNLVDGAYSLGLFGDVATEMCILTDGDEGLFASYSDVQFRAPVRAGDVLEITCEITRVGSRSRGLDFAVHVVARGAATAERPGAAGCSPSRCWPRPPPAPSSSPADRDARFGVSRATRRPGPRRFSGDSSSGAPPLTCGFRAFPQVRRLLTVTRGHDQISSCPLMQIVASGPASEWLCRRMGRHHSSDIVRGGRSRSTRADTEGSLVP